MRDFETKCYSIYGASMGRGSNACLTGKVSLVRVKLDSGGYDKGGAYWGIGAPLYCATSEQGEVQYMRGRDRQAVKDALSTIYTDIKFYR
jgi:hypothetical protein